MQITQLLTLRMLNDDTGDDDYIESQGMWSFLQILRNPIDEESTLTLNGKLCLIFALSHRRAADLSNNWQRSPRHVI